VTRPAETDVQTEVWRSDELLELVATSHGNADALSAIAKTIQRASGTDVCSLYLLEADRLNLTLGATIGLRPDSVGRIRMRLTEGLVGLVAEQMRPVVVQDTRTHPRFKYFQDAGEELYRTFLGVPVCDRSVLQGVLVLQTVEARLFGEGDIQALASAALQIAPIVSEARAVGQIVAPILQRLIDLARNLWWTWDTECNHLFRALDPVAWRECNHNPLAMLRRMPFDDLEKRASQLALNGRINQAHRRLQEYLRAKHTWGERHASILGARPVAYFSAEFGLHESIPIYSGGLGILAGDHLKSASDLGIPLVGIGLYYDQGYFRQRLDADGWQGESYIHVEHSVLPMAPATDRGIPITVEIETRTGTILARVWKVQVGRNTLLLLDSNVDGNSPEDRELTARLYGGDQRIRIRQELLLGVGGVRALVAAGIAPSVIHLNEGHSAFATLELVRRRMDLEGIGVDEALRRVAAQVVFTTHTPVPAGHDRFSPELIEEHLGPLRDGLGLSPRDFLALGREQADAPHEEFCMTVLALRTSQRANAVSSLHGQVSRAMWSTLYGASRDSAVPIGHITNGVHVNTWLAPQMRLIYERHLGSAAADDRGEVRWDAVDGIDDGELWEAHQTLKFDLINEVRRRLVAQAERRGDAPALVAQLRRALSPDALTIGFARRFATYKRANLLLQDLEMLESLVNNAQMPVQLIFAGKAHPLDAPGKTVLQQVAQLTRDPRFLGKIVFVEDYDIDVGRHLVQGVDIWLNNPRRPLEACGTSGQKVVLNGGLNLSVLDGWWAEAYDGLNGFAIGQGETHTAIDIHDQRDATALCRVLHDEVVPLYYERDPDGLPARWVSRMKRAIRTLGWRFSAERMVVDYVKKAYIPAAGGTSSDLTAR
jgi:starch phosphorylase